MEEQIKLVKSYLAGVWLSRKYILIFAWIICPIGWVYVSMLPNQYTSKAVVYADTQSILKPLLRGLTIFTDPSERLELVARTLLNSKNVETIGNDVDANIRANTKAEYDSMLQELKSGIKISTNSSRRDNLYTISFTGDEPIYARNVVQSALNVFIETILGDKRTDSEEAQDVISGQISFYENRLIESEKQLADFKRENIGLMPGSGNNYYSKLAEFQNMLEEDKLSLKEIQSRIFKVQQQIKDLSSLSATQTDNFETEYDNRINAISIRLDDLLYRFTDKHPDVIETRRQLAEVNNLKAEYLKTINPEELVQNNPIYRNLKITLNELNNEHVSLEVRIAKQQADIAELQEKLDLIPEVEAMLKSLNRDYAITKQKYEALVSRGETASISSSVDSVSDNIKFRTIESPNLPTSASGPNRTFYSVSVLLLGLGAGLGFAVLISILKPVASSVEQVQNSTGIPVIGVVTASEKSGFIRKDKYKKTLFFVLLFLLFMLFYVAVNHSNILLNFANYLIQMKNSI